MKIVKGEEYTNAMLEGINKLADCVKMTLGPAGRNILIENPSSYPLITKDGVTVAKTIILQDRFENLGAQLAKNVALNTLSTVGDGTTTATVLAQSLCNNIKEYVLSKGKDIDIIEVKRGVIEACALIATQIKDMSKEVSTKEDFYKVAMISTNGDETLSNILAEAIDKVTPKGTITTTDSKTSNIRLEVENGVKFDRGPVTPLMLGQNGKKITLENPIVFVSYKKLAMATDILMPMQVAGKAGRPLFIVAPEIDGDALTMLTVNNAKGTLTSCAIKAPVFAADPDGGLKDFEAICDAVGFKDEYGEQIESFPSDWFGSAKAITVDSHSTVVIDGKGGKEGIERRCEELRETRDNSGEEGPAFEQFNVRIGSMLGGIAVIYVGAMTEIEQLEIKDRLDDAIHSLKAAADGGVVEGGGWTLIQIKKGLEAVIEELRKGSDDIQNKSYVLGYEVVANSIDAPFNTIAENAGVAFDEDEIIKAINDGTGFNAKTRKFEKLEESGIIDPALVTRSAILNACSIASTWMMSGAGMCIEDDKKDDPTKNFTESMY